MISQKKFLILLFALALLVRAFVFTALIQKDNNAWFYPDSEQYNTAALQFVDGKGNTNPDGSPQMYRLAGYPLFLAACYKVFGLNVNRALWGQIILASFIPLLIFYLSLVLFPAQIMIARGAGIFAAAHVGFCLYAGMVASETLSLIVLLCFFILFFSCVRSQAIGRTKSNGFFLTGLVLGIASLIRPIGHYTLVICILLLMLQHEPSIQRLKKILSLTGGWLLIVAPWLIRNFLLTGSLFFHTLPGLHFLQYAAANVIMERDNSSYNVVRPMLLRQWEEAIAIQTKFQGKTLNEYQRCVIAEKLAFGYMWQHPWYTVKTSAIQMLKSCCSLYTAQTLLSDSGVWPGYTRDTTLWTKIKRFLFPAVKHTVLIPIIYCEILCMIFIMLGMGLFCVSLIFNRAWLAAFLQVIPFMLMFIVITLAYGCARLRFPIEPFLIIFSCAGWVWIYDCMLTKKKAF